MPFNVVSKPTLEAFWRIHPSTKGPLLSWHAAVSKATWTCFADVRKTYNSADQVGKLIVFNVNRNRIIVDVAYAYRHIYIRHVLSHEEYDAWTNANR